MHIDAKSLAKFYDTREGQIVRDILHAHINNLWDDVKSSRILGLGYALPYLHFEGAERCLAAMPSAFGAAHWPDEAANKTCLFGGALPFETNSIDRVLLIHGLEHSANAQHDISEIYRVLKSSGRAIMIVPNRAGLWARFDWSPMGQGRPYSRAQLHKILNDNRFTIEHIKEALFVPPIRWRSIFKSAKFFEKTGRILPLPAGVHIVEVSKQIYARADKGTKAPAFAKPFMPKPALNKDMLT